MASGLTINVSAASAGLLNTQSTQPAQKLQGTEIPTQEQVARASQIATERVASDQAKIEAPTVRIPKRVEPGYSPPKKKKKSGASPTEEENEGDQAPREETLDLKA
jgi:hypothetical protein